MDNFSVIASLVLIGLFFRTSPSEGYVVGYIDFSDQSLQSSLLKRQEEPIMNNKKPEDGILYGSVDNSQFPIMKPEFPNIEYDPSRHGISSNHVTADGERQEDGILWESVDRQEEEGRANNVDVQADVASNNKNDNNLAEKKSVAYTQVPSRL